MKIKNFLILFSLICLAISIFLNYKYLYAKTIQTKNNLLTENYYVKDIRCSYTYKMGSHIDVMFMNKEYNVEIPTNKCEELNDGKIEPKLYYDLNKDKIFFEDYYMPIGYVKISYFITFIIPLIGLLIYRKELNNNYKTM